MKQIRYNQIKYARLKASILGVLVTIQGLSLIYNFGIAENISVILSVATTLLPLVAMILFYRFSFGEVFEVTGNDTIMTYTEFGPFKWNIKRYTRLRNLTIDQGEDRFYVITAEHANGRLILERHPTLDKAEEKISELRSALVE